MKRLVEFPLDQGGSVIVEVDEPSAGPTLRGLKDRPAIVEQAGKTFQDAVAANFKISATWRRRAFEGQTP